MQYHGVEVPDCQVDPHKMISGFTNPIDWEKVEEYAAMTRASDPPAVWGWPSIIDEADVGSVFFMDDTPVAEEHIGQQVWYVSDGHHRVMAALEVGIHLYVALDPSCRRQAEAEESWKYWDTWLKTND